MQQEPRDNFFTELLKFVIVAALIVFPIRFFVAQPFIVSGASMEPTFESGQYLIIDELSYRIAPPERGDVVIFRYPRNPKEFFIKRIIALPGETLYIQKGDVSVKKTSGEVVSLNEPYVANPGNGNNATYVVGSDEYFVMGDNRPESSDSRVWGMLPREDIVGRAFLRLLPFNTSAFLPGDSAPQ